MRARNRSLTTAVRAEASERIFARVERTAAFSAARCVALFCALGDEPATEDALARWSAGARRVVVPRVEGDMMQFYDYNPSALRTGAFGILEPVVVDGAAEVDEALVAAARPSGIAVSEPAVAKHPLSIAAPVVARTPCDPADIDLIVVPGVAFTAEGARMGRGKGFYDKYLSQAGFRAVKIGVCYAHQLVPVLPVEAHDVAMDRVVTDIGSYVCNR